MSRSKKTEYIYKTPDLCRVMGVSRQTIVNYEREGKLTCPRSVGNQRIFTDTQLYKIKLAFMPGGPGQWHFKPFYKHVKAREEEGILTSTPQDYREET